MAITQSQQAIVEAAASLFRRQGFEATTMRDIAAAVGLSKAGVYHHYRSKEDLLADVVEAATTALMDQLGAVEGEDLEPGAKLEFFVRTRMETIAAHQDMLTVIWQERPAIDQQTFEAVAARLETYRAKVTALIAAAQAADAIRPDLDPHMLMLAIDGMTGWSYLWLRPGHDHSPAEIGDEFWAYMWRGVRPE